MLFCTALKKHKMVLCLIKFRGDGVAAPNPFPPPEWSSVYATSKENSTHEQRGLGSS